MGECRLCKPEVAGSTPAVSIIPGLRNGSAAAFGAAGCRFESCSGILGSVAQWVEHGPFKPVAEGSSPSALTAVG